MRSKHPLVSTVLVENASLIVSYTLLLEGVGSYSIIRQVHLHRVTDVNCFTEASDQHFLITAA